MFGRVRWLIIGTAFVFVSASLMMSCGGGSGCSSGTYDAYGNYVPGTCPGGGPVSGYQLESITVCAGPPESPTPTPSGSASPTPTVTPCPQATSTSVASGLTIQFHADGLFTKKQKTKVADITNSRDTLWASSDANVLVPPGSGNGGLYNTALSGCACLSASSGGLVSLPVGVTVFPSSGPTPSCPPCPTPIPSPSPAALTASTSLASSSTGAGTTGVLQWGFDSAMPLEGPVAGSADGTAYFVTADSVLHAVVAPGAEKWRTLAGGESVVVSPDGSTIYTDGASGKLDALSADGKLRWSADVALSQGPLVASADSVFAVSNDGRLLSVSAPGLIQWEVPFGGTVARAVALSDGGVAVASAGGAVTAVSADGTVRWSFTPDGGFAGSLAVQGGAVYAGSEDGTVYTLDVASGGEIWHFAGGAPIAAGPVVDSQGSVFFASDSVYALDANGALKWREPLLSTGPVALAATSGGLFAATPDGVATMFSDGGSAQWATRSFGTVQWASFSPADVLYVVNADGHVWALK